MISSEVVSQSVFLLFQIVCCLTFGNAFLNALTEGTMGIATFAAIHAKAAVADESQCLFGYFSLARMRGNTRSSTVTRW